MNKNLLFPLLILVASSQLQVVYAKETGKTLHDSKCLGCHDSEAYTRKDRIIKSLPALSQRVRICTKNAAKADWNDAQINSVVEYLDTRYYNF